MKKAIESYSIPTFTRDLKILSKTRKNTKSSINSERIIIINTMQKIRLKFFWESKKFLKNLAKIIF